MAFTAQAFKVLIESTAANRGLKVVAKLFLAMCLLGGMEGAQGHTRRTPEYSFAQLENWLEIPGNKFREIEDVVEQLPESLRTHYTLMHKSQSMQPASLSRPRAILYGETADFVAAFSGHSRAKKNKIEFMQFDREALTYELRFLTKQPGPDGTPQLTLSARNPETCTACHRADPRPNWENYPNWPGAVGAEDDFIFENTEHGSRGMNQQEVRELVQFAQEAEQLPLYRKLKPLLVEEKSNYAGGYGIKKLKDVDPNQYSNIFYLRVYGNRELNQLFANQNNKRIVRKITEDTSFYQAAKVAIMAAFKECDDFERFIPHTALSNPLSFLRIRNEMSESMAGNDMFRKHDVEVASRLRSIYESYGKGSDDLSMSFSTSGYRFTSRASTGLQEILSDLLRHSPELGPLYTCDELARGL